MKLSVQDKIHDPKLVDNAIVSDIIAELVYLESNGIALDGDHYGFKV
jgi:hypothetical protein